MQNDHVSRMCAAGLLFVFAVPAAAFAEEPRPVERRPPTLDGALATARTAAFTQRRRRSRAPRSGSATQRSWGRTLTGLTVSVGGLVTAHVSNGRIGEITDRNGVRNEWNAVAATVDELLQDYDRVCTGRSFDYEQCLEVFNDGLSPNFQRLRSLAGRHEFLPQVPDVGDFITSQEERLIREWSVTSVDLESKGPWTGMFWGGLGAGGVGALLATVWSDVPVLRNVRVHSAPRRIAATTSVTW